MIRGSHRYHGIRILGHNAENPVGNAGSGVASQRFGKDMDGTPARAFTATMVLLEAIDRAGSTQPEAIRKALGTTNLGPDQIIMPWPGVKFDAAGQNVLSRGIFVQNRGGHPRLVWPFDGAAVDLVWPHPAWK